MKNIPNTTKEISHF